MLYWSIGHDILAEQQAGGWGDDVVERIAEDLRLATGSARGFSRRNLFYMRRFAALWPEVEKVPSVRAQISWTAHRSLLDRFAGDRDLYVWYAAKAAENRWSVRHLQGQIALWTARAPRLRADELRGCARAGRRRSGAAGDEGPVHLRLPRARRGRPRARPRAGADRRYPEVPAGARHWLRVLRSPEAAARRRAGVLHRLFRVSVIPITL